MRTALDGKIAAINGRLACLGLAWSLLGLVWFVWFVLVSFAWVRPRAGEGQGLSCELQVNAIGDEMSSRRRG